jgi:DNA mismatch repair ATPase MutS
MGFTSLAEATESLTQAADHIEQFLMQLRKEMAFFVGCLNLNDVLKSRDLHICIPVVQPLKEFSRRWESLYDISLVLTTEKPVIGNTHESDHHLLHIVTGANQGGKTTFLRSMGQAQLMAQCGMFVGALRFVVPVRKAIFTHFRKEEDPSMIKGKFDEELSRMSGIADHLSQGCLILFNESFSSTNEREGSEIARQISRALLENQVEAFHVTHLLDFASSMVGSEQVEFLRAERLEDGSRTFRILPGILETTAYGEDLFREVFRGQKESDSKSEKGPNLHS